MAPVLPGSGAGMMAATSHVSAPAHAGDEVATAEVGVLRLTV
jgi:hypothetical protein